MTSTAAGLGRVPKKSSIRKDPLYNAVNDGMRRDIDVAMTNGCLRAAIILIYSAMDAMAYLGMPATQEETTRADFIAWAGRYIRFPGTEQLSGEDLYGARCAMLHAYGVRSRLSRAGKCRIIGYMDQSNPPVRYNPRVNEGLALLSVPALKESLFRGMDNFLIDLFADSRRRAIAEARLREFIVTLPARG